MAEGQRAGEARSRTAISAAPCGSAPIRRCSTRGSKVAEIYGATEISERHRHRYEVNIAYKGRLEQHGMRFSGMSPDGVLPEIVEYADHPWFIGVQYPPRAEVAAVRAAPAVRLLHRRGGGAEPAGVVRRASGSGCAMNLCDLRQRLMPSPLRASSRRPADCAKPRATAARSDASSGRLGRRA